MFLSITLKHDLYEENSRALRFCIVLPLQHALGGVPCGKCLHTGDLVFTGHSPYCPCAPGCLSWKAWSQSRSHNSHRLLESLVWVLRLLCIFKGFFTGLSNSSCPRLESLDQVSWERHESWLRIANQTHSKLLDSLFSQTSGLASTFPLYC